MPHTLSGTSVRTTQAPTGVKSRFRGPSFGTAQTHSGQTHSGHRTHHPSRAGFRREDYGQAGERLGHLALTWAWLLVVPVDLVIWAVSLNGGLDGRLANQLMLLAALLGTLISVWALLRSSYEHARMLLWLSRLGTLTALVQLVSTFRSLSGHL